MNISEELNHTLLLFSVLYRFFMEVENNVTWKHMLNILMFFSNCTPELNVPYWYWQHSNYVIEAYFHLYCIILPTTPSAEDVIPFDTQDEPLVLNIRAIVFSLSKKKKNLKLKILNTWESLCLKVHFSGNQHAAIGMIEVVTVFGLRSSVLVQWLWNSRGSKRKK